MDLTKPPNGTLRGVRLQLSDGYVQRYKKQPRVQVDMQVKEARKEYLKDSRLPGGRAPPLAGAASGNSTSGRKKLSSGGGVAGTAGPAGETSVAKPDFKDER